MINSNKQLKQQWANLLQQRLPSATPRCPYFGECGGCALQHLSCADQLGLKRQVVRDIWGDQLPNDFDLQITGSPQEYEYRQRMDYVASHNPIHAPHDRMGLRKRKQFSFVLDLAECYLIPPVVFKQTRTIFEYALSMGIPVYDLVKQTGWLKYLVVRQAGDERMLIVVGASTEYEADMTKLSEYALTQGFTSVYWLINDSLSDISFGQVHHYWGEQYLLTLVRAPQASDIRLAVGPNNFFQNNIRGFEQILAHVQPFITEEKTTTLADLYCGVGTIGLSFAGEFDQVWGCELSAESVELAQHNAESNKIGNAQFVAGDVRELQKHLSLNTSDLVAVVDPPRTGLEPKGVEELLRLNPKRVAYISCNPLTQMLDWQLLRQKYRMVSLQAFDMFPQTLHVESVLLMEHNY